MAPFQLQEGVPPYRAGGSALSRRGRRPCGGRRDTGEAVLP